MEGLRWPLIWEGLSDALGLKLMPVQVYGGSHINIKTEEEKLIVFQSTERNWKDVFHPVHVL